MRQTAFTPHSERPHLLLIGEDGGIGPMVGLADSLRSRRDADWRILVLLGSETTPFPFRPRPSVIVVPGIPAGTIACMPLLEEWGVASRLASRTDRPGCFDGAVTDLAAHWLRGLSPAGLTQVEIFACGPTPMLEVTADIARRFALPFQLADSHPVFAA
jgi:dihydroorotate dehydrogenase electron transfer subunit